MDKFTELEYKYKADGIGLADFRKLMGDAYEKRLDVSSWDTYYTSSREDFIRYRESASQPELTIKRKNREHNNWSRSEVDIKLSQLQNDEVKTFVNMLGFQHNFTIYKSCFIYWQKNVNYVYYITYDEHMRELGRFIEVEFNKECIETTENPQVELDQAEKRLSVLGISPGNRLRRSLYEIYRRIDDKVKE